MTVRRPAARAALRASALAAALALGVGLGTYGSGGDTLMDSQRSPDGRERLDFYHATRWQALLEPNADMLGYVRLVGDEGNEVSAASPAFDMSGSGPTLWTRDGVQVGVAARYDRRARRWSVDG